MDALVTGASSGIGKDIAKYLGSLGYSVILVARDKKELEKVQKEIKSETEILVSDLGNEKEVYELYNKVKNKDIKILVNNAGFGLFGNFYETNLDKELNMIDVNIKAVHILTKLFLQDMVKKNDGYILNVASSAGFIAGPNLNTYYATKNYVLKLTMAINEELRQNNKNIQVSALCPGPVKTNFNKVANGEFDTKGMTSTYVAKYGIDNLFKRKMIIIPGIKYKMGIFIQRFLPYRVILKFIFNFQRRKQK